MSARQGAGCPLADLVAIMLDRGWPPLPGCLQVHRPEDPQGCILVSPCEIGSTDAEHLKSISNTKLK